MNTKRIAGPPGWPQLALSGATTLCAFSTRECRASCLALSGQNEVPRTGAGAFSPYMAYLSKMSLTAALYRDPAAFARLLLSGIQRHFTARSKEANVFPYVRLNVLSDIPWELLFPDLIHTDLALQPVEHEKNSKLSRGQFYDYTKIPGRHNSDLYDKTYSYAGSIDSEREMQACLQRNQRVAVVFVQQILEKPKSKSVRVQGLPEWKYSPSGGLLLKQHAVQQGRAFVYPWKFLGHEVLSGGISDIRPQDPEGLTPFPQMLT